MPRWRYGTFDEALAAARADTPGSGGIVPAVALVHCLERAAQATALPDANADDQKVLVAVRSRVVTRVMRALSEVPDEALPQADLEVGKEPQGTGVPNRRRAVRMVGAYIKLSRRHWSSARKRRFEEDTGFVRSAKNRVVKDQDGNPISNRGKHEVDNGPFGELRARLVHLVRHDLEARG